ncbi:MAG: ABC transporter permease [Bacillota bacterium]
MTATRGFYSLLKQDLVVAQRNGFFLVVLCLAVIFAILVRFVIPAEVKVTAREYVVDLTEGQVISDLLVRKGLADILLPSEEELLSLMQEDRNTLGIVFQGSREKPGAVIHYQGYEPKKALAALSAAVSSLWNEAGALGRPSFSTPVLLRPESSKLPFNLSMIPLLMVTEVVFLGFLFVAVMVFQEKAEGSIRAYRVSPRGTWTYILSKSVTNVILALCYGLLIFLPTIGPTSNLIAVLPLIILASFLMTVAGLSISVFFDSLSDFIYAALPIFVLFCLPVASYFFPAFKMPVFELIPSYPLMFGIREILFPTGKAGFYAPMLLRLAAESAVVLLVAGWAVNRNLLKEVQ